MIITILPDDAPTGKCFSNDRRKSDPIQGKDPDKDTRGLPNQKGEDLSRSKVALDNKETLGELNARYEEKLLETRQAKDPKAPAVSVAAVENGSDKGKYHAFMMFHSPSKNKYSQNSLKKSADVEHIDAEVFDF